MPTLRTLDKRKDSSAPAAASVKKSKKQPAIPKPGALHRQAVNVLLNSKEMKQKGWTVTANNSNGQKPSNSNIKDDEKAEPRRITADALSFAGANTAHSKLQLQKCPTERTDSCIEENEQCGDDTVRRISNETLDELEMLPSKKLKVDTSEAVIWADNNLTCTTDIVGNIAVSGKPCEKKIEQEKIAVDGGTLPKECEGENSLTFQANECKDEIKDKGMEFPVNDSTGLTSINEHENDSNGHTRAEISTSDLEKKDENVLSSGDASAEGMDSSVKQAANDNNDENAKKMHLSAKHEANEMIADATIKPNSVVNKESNDASSEEMELQVSPREGFNSGLEEMEDDAASLDSQSLLSTSNDNENKGKSNEKKSTTTPLSSLKPCILNEKMVDASLVGHENDGKENKSPKRSTVKTTSLQHRRGTSSTALPTEPVFLVPLNPEQCQALLNYKHHDEYKVPNDNDSHCRGAFPIHIGKEFSLAGNKFTGIKSDLISRSLCTVTVCCVDKEQVASVVVHKPPEMHAVHLNGEKINSSEPMVLSNGSVLSLYGPIGFAYRVQI
jgi:hypothetical protein